MDCKRTDLVAVSIMYRIGGASHARTNMFRDIVQDAFNFSTRVFCKRVVFGAELNCDRLCVVIKHGVFLLVCFDDLYLSRAIGRVNR